MLEEEEVGVVLRKRGRRARRYVLRSFSSDLTARVLKRCFTKRSRGTSSFNSGERVFLLRCCIMAKNGINNSVAVGIAVQSDWDNRHFSSSLTLNVRRLFEFLLQFGKLYAHSRLSLLVPWFLQKLQRAPGPSYDWSFWFFP